MRSLISCWEQIMLNNANNLNNSQFLKFHAINANSIVARDKRHTLDIHLKAHKPDFVLLSETRLHARHKIFFKNYSIIRDDQIDGTRGTAILIKDCFQHKVIKINPKPDLEVTAISVSFGSRNLYIFSIYQSWRTGVIDCNTLRNFFNMAKDNDCVIVGGDFNARHTSWKNSINNYNGITLFNWYEAHKNLLDIKMFHSTKPSRVGHNSVSYIDLFMVSDNFQIVTNNAANTLDTFQFDSDHFIVELKVILPKLERKEPKMIFNFDKADWRVIGDYLSEVLINALPMRNRNLSCAEIDVEVDKLNNFIMNALDYYVPKTKLLPGNLLILKEVTIRCIKLKKDLRRRWFRSGCRDTTTKSFIDRISNIIKNLVKSQYSAWFESKMKSVKPGPKLYQNLKRFYNNSSKDITLIDNCCDEVESAEALALHFSEVHNNSPAANANNTSDEPNVFTNNLSGSTRDPLFQFNELTPSDRSVNFTDPMYDKFSSIGTIQEIIRSRKNLKSTGPNKLSNYVMRKLPSEYAHYLCIIINNCYNLGYFPKGWKKADVVPIPKNRAATANIDDYRPISLLNCESKIYECFLRDILIDFAEDHNLIHPLQFGFTKSRSTNHAISYFMEYAHSGFRDKNSTLAVSIDLKKAFDTVWVNGLIYKLHVGGFSDHLCYAVFNFLSGRSFRVRFGDKLSSSYPIKAGVPQGSILGPALFNFFMADFPADGVNQIKSIFFADDILIFKHSRHIPNLILSINNYLVAVSRYFDYWNLSVNHTKCESILIRKYESFITKRFKSFKNNENINIRIDGQNILAKNSIKYLGIIIDKKLSVIPHIDQTLRKVKGAYHVVCDVFLKKSISARVKIIAYKQLIRPIITYNFPGWCWLSSRQMERLRVCERKILYKCLPVTEAYKWNNDDDFFSRISKKALYTSILGYEKTPKMKRLDVTCINLFLNFCRKLEFCHLPELRNIVDVNYGGIFRDNNAGGYIYKSFPPSFLYYLHDNGTLYANNALIFYNRRFNANNFNSFVYDLPEPD